MRSWAKPLEGLQVQGCLCLCMTQETSHTRAFNLARHHFYLHPIPHACCVGVPLLSPPIVGVPASPCPWLCSATPGNSVRSAKSFFQEKKVALLAAETPRHNTYHSLQNTCDDE